MSPDSPDYDGSKLIMLSVKFDFFRSIPPPPPAEALSLRHPDDNNDRADDDNVDDDDNDGDGKYVDTVFNSSHSCHPSSALWICQFWSSRRT